MWNLNYKDKNIFDYLNNFVKNEKHLKKRFCCLVCTHDTNLTRTKILHEILKIGNVECPSKFNNNCSNKEINSLYEVNYFKLLIESNFRVFYLGFIRLAGFSLRVWYN